MGLTAVVDLSAELLKIIEAKSHPRFVSVIVWALGLGVICGALLLLGQLAVGIGTLIKEIYHAYTGHPPPVDFRAQLIGLGITFALYVIAIGIFERWNYKRMKLLKNALKKEAEELDSIVSDCKAFTDANHASLAKAKQELINQGMQIEARLREIAAASELLIEGSRRNLEESESASNQAQVLIAEIKGHLASDRHAPTPPDSPQRT
jgi:hypothetical protein